MPASLRRHSVGGTDWTAPLKNADGLIDPDQIAVAVFDAVHRLFDAFDVGSTRSIELDNVEVVLPEGTGIDGLRIGNALLSQADDGDMQLSADLVVDGRSVTIEGSASRDIGVQADHRPEARHDGVRRDRSRMASRSPADVRRCRGGAINPAAVDMLGPFAVNLGGEEGTAEQPSKLSLSAAIGRSKLRASTAGTISKARSISRRRSRLARTRRGSKT